MSQESSTVSTTIPVAKPKSRGLTLVLLLILAAIGLFGIDRWVEGKLFRAVQEAIVTTIGGGMSEQQKSNVDQFQKRLTELHKQRETIAKGEVSVIPTAIEGSEDKSPALAEPSGIPDSETKPTDASEEEKAGKDSGTF